jgi:ABC-2 type transport system permease protein
MRAEWIKLRSTSSTHYAVGVAALVFVLGLAWTLYVDSIWHERGLRSAAAPEDGFLPVVQLSMAVLGVLAVTGEYATGLIRQTLTAVPNRARVLIDKIVVVAVTTFSVSAAVLLATASAARLVGDYPMAALDVPRLLGHSLAATVLALAGLGLGAVTRSTAAGVTGVVGLLFVLPGIANVLPSPWNSQVGSVMLPNLVPQMFAEKLSTRLGLGLLEPPVAVGVLLLYAIVPLAVGWFAFTRRDA